MPFPPDSNAPLLTLETSVSKALMAEALDVSFDREYYFDPWRRREVDARCHRYAEEALQDLDAFYTESNLGRKAWFDRNQVLVGGIQPNLILGMLLGAEFVPAPRGDADISPACWAGLAIEDLPPPNTLPDHPLIRADGVDYLSSLTDQWGKICLTDRLRAHWIEQLLPNTTRALKSFRDDFYYFCGTAACLSCLLESGRYDELRRLLDLDDPPFWPFETYWAQALVRQGAG